MKLIIAIENAKTLEPIRKYTYQGKVFCYQVNNKIIVSENEKISRIYLEENETFTIYNYEE